MIKFTLIMNLVVSLFCSMSFAETQNKTKLECSVYNVTYSPKELIVKWPMEILREERELMGVDSNASETIQINKRLSLNLQVSLLNRKTRSVTMMADFSLAAPDRDIFGTTSVRVYAQKASLPISRSLEFSYKYTSEEDADMEQNRSKYPSIFEIVCR